MTMDSVPVFEHLDIQQVLEAYPLGMNGPG